MNSVKERSIFEVNRWGHIIPLNFGSLSIYGQCIMRTVDHFQYPQCFSALVGNFLLCNTQHFTQQQINSLKNHEKIKDLQVLAKEIIQFGWNQDNSNPNVVVEKLDALLDTLCTMSQVSKQTFTSFEPLSTICSNVENQWIQQSSKMMKSVFQDISDGGFLAHISVPSAQGKYDSYIQNQAQMFSLFSKRMQEVLNRLGTIPLKMDNFSYSVYFVFAKSEAFTSLKDQVDYLTGFNNSSETLDGQEMSQLPTTNCYTFLEDIGVFVHRKQEKLHFKKIHDTLRDILRNDDVCHLFIMSIILNTDEARSLQNFYNHLLVKKLAEICLGFGEENGDKMLCLFRKLAIDYTQLFGRFNLEMKKDFQKVALLKGEN